MFSKQTGGSNSIPAGCSRHGRLHCCLLLHPRKKYPTGTIDKRREESYRSLLLSPFSVWFVSFVLNRPCGRSVEGTCVTQYTIVLSTATIVPYEYAQNATNSVHYYVFIFSPDSATGRESGWWCRVPAGHERQVPPRIKMCCCILFLFSFLWPVSQHRVWKCTFGMRSGLSWNRIWRKQFLIGSCVDSDQSASYGHTKCTNHMILHQRSRLSGCYFPRRKSKQTNHLDFLFFCSMAIDYGWLSLNNTEWRDNSHVDHQPVTFYR